MPRHWNFSAPLDTVEFRACGCFLCSPPTISTAIEFFSLETETRHRALEDARITGRVYLKLLDMLRVLPDGLLAEMNALSSRTGSSLAEVFEAHLMERIERPTEFRGLAHKPDTRILRPDNMFGDFSTEDRPDAESRGFVMKTD